jgi:hypothetical protein
MSLVLLVDTNYSEQAIRDCQQWCRSLATASGEIMQMVVVQPEGVSAVWRALRDSGTVAYRDFFVPGEPDEPVRPKAPQPFLWDGSGRPNWVAMGAAMADLAIFGGVPSRTADAPVRRPADPCRVDTRHPAVSELRRGIWETTGLYAEPAAEAGWLAITCDSISMAAWLTACLILEHIDARCDEERLLVPVSPTFQLHDEVHSVVLAIAKTVRYWRSHTGKEL